MELHSSYGLKIINQQTKQNDNSNNKHLQFCKLSFFKKKDTECFKTKCDCSAGCENDEKDADNGLQDQRVWSPDECADIFSQRLVSWKSIFCLNANKLIPSTYWRFTPEVNFP